MSCEALPYINSDIDLSLDIPITEIPTADISDISFKFILISDSSVTKEYKLSLGEISYISDGSYSVSILNTHITTEGWYKIELTVTDVSSRVRAVSACYHADTPYIKFYRR